MSTAVPALRTDPPAAGVVLPGPRRPSEPADAAPAAVPPATSAPSSAPSPAPAPAPRPASNAPMVLLTAALVLALGLAVHLGMTAEAWHERAGAATARQAQATATTTALRQRVDALQDDLDASDTRIEQLAAEKARAADLAAATAQRSNGSSRSATATATTAPVLAPAVGQDDALRTASRASVRLRSIGCTGVETGSGFAVDAHTLVTNAHVVTGAQRLQVDTWDGHELLVTGAVVEVGADLAVVRVREELPTSLRLADADPAIGEAVTVVGYPRGEALARAGGTVVGPVADPLGASAGRVLAVDAQVAPGSSGSAVVDAAGAVVGVVYAGATTGEHAYAVPVSALRTALSAAPSSSSSGPSGGC